MSSRSFDDLHPDLKPLAKIFLCRLSGSGINVLITCTWRSPEEQTQLYAQGRTAPGRIVTNAKAGQSEHNFMLNGKSASKAFDIVPVTQGRAVWDTSAPEWAEIAREWQLGVSNATHYLDWYGREGTPFREYAHFCLKKIGE